jgi:hypothetical protein
VQEVPEWDRYTLLYQGAILPAAVTAKIGLTLAGHETDFLAAIVSHDCDLVTEPNAEPFVELVLGCPISEKRGALELLGKHLKLFTEKLELGHSLTVDFLDEILDERSKKGADARLTHGM